MTPAEPGTEPADARPPLWRQPLVWVGFLLSGGALVAFVSLFEAGQVWASLRQLELWVVPVAGAVFLSSYLVRALRWRLLLSPLGQLPYGQVRDVLLTGFMVNNILPARAGELARALVLWKVTGTGRRAALATIGVERLFDGMVLIGMLSLLGGAFAEVPDWATRMGHVTTAVLGALAAVSLWLAFHHRSLLRLVEAGLFFLPRRWRERVTGFLARFVDGMQVLRRPRVLVLVLLLSAVVWSMEVVVYYLMMWGIGIELPPWAAMLALVVTNFGIAVPSAPGHVGVYEAACSGAVMALGVASELALSYAIAVHLLLFVCITGSGLLLMWRLGLRLGELTGRDG